MDNIIAAYEILYLVKHSKESSLLLKLDFEKIFINVELELVFNYI
jgi:hypothetical protein